MLFFKRILQEPAAKTASPAPAPPTPPTVPPVERRSTKRYPVHPDFRLKTVLCFIGRDGSGARLSASPIGWDWKGRLIDLSERGARLLLGAAALAAQDDACELRLSLEDIALEIPCHVANIREHGDGFAYGLVHDITDGPTRAAYAQLLEIVALGSSLKLHNKSAKPDPTGYVVEHYTSNRPARLTIWRHPDDEAVGAFQFLLKDSIVRANAGQNLEFLTAAGDKAATPAKAREIYRLFRWVVPNLAPAVPDDVRRFLRRFAN